MSAPLVSLAAALSLTGCPQAAPPAPAPPTPAASPTPDAPPDARAQLEQIVRERCVDAQRPWALAHAVLVLGAELRLPDGSLAIERLVVDNLPPDSLVFPRRRGETPVDAHPGLILKTLLEVGVPPERAFTASGGRTVRLAELVAAARAEGLDERAPVPLGNQAWRLEVMAEVAPPELRQRALEVLVENQAYFETWAKDPQRPYRKATVVVDGRRAPGAIHRYFCGGFHLFQAVQRLHGKELPPELARQYELLLLRLELETHYWEQAWAQVSAKAPPDLARHRRVILSQRLKLQGHALETYLRAVRVGALALSETVKPRLTRGFQALAATVAELQSAGVVASLPALEAEDPQLYRDLVGDAAHALHAWVLAEAAGLPTR